MTKIKLTIEVTKNPDFGGWNFYVPQGQGFCVGDYADAYNISRDSINKREIGLAQAAAKNLKQSEWLAVSH